jgi:hypothetical protein
MALNHNIIPQTSLVFGVRDFAPQIDALQKGDTEGLQNAFKFGTQVYDAIKNGQIADEMQKEDPDYKKIDALAAKRINNPDTSFSNWRWKQGQDQAAEFRKQDLERIEKEKAKAKEEQKQFIRNKISATLPTMSIGWKTSPEQIQQFKNTLAGLKTEAMNSNLSDEYNNILEAEAQLNGQLPQQKAQMAMDAMANATNLFNVTKEEGGFGKDPKAYHDYLLQKYTEITRDFPEAKYDPAFNKAFSDADKLYRKKVKTNKVKPSGRR